LGTAARRFWAVIQVKPRKMATRYVKEDLIRTLIDGRLLALALLFYTPSNDMDNWPSADGSNKVAQ